MVEKALFLDRDGVINHDPGYVYKSEEIEFIDGLFDFARRAHQLGYKIIVVTNQAGIGRGLYTEAQFHTLMRWMQEKFAVEGCPMTAYYFCPHHPEHGQGDYRRECDCRKPMPGMILQAIREHHIDPKQSLLVGDRQSDLEAGKAAGVARLELFEGTFPSL